MGQFEVFNDYHYLGGRKKGYETWLKTQEAAKLAELKKRLEEEAAKPQPAKGKGKDKAKE